MNELAVYEANELSDEAQTPVDMSATDYTAEAIAAIADLDDESRIDKMMRVGAAIMAAKDALPHGALTSWYKNVLRRSESWCSLLSPVPGSRHPAGRARLGGEDES